MCLARALREGSRLSTTLRLHEKRRDVDLQYLSKLAKHLQRRIADGSFDLRHVGPIQPGRQRQLFLCCAVLDTQLSDVVREVQADDVVVPSHCR